MGNILSFSKIIAAPLILTIVLGGSYYLDHAFQLGVNYGFADTGEMILFDALAVAFITTGALIQRGRTLFVAFALMISTLNHTTLGYNYGQNGFDHSFFSIPLYTTEADFALEAACYESSVFSLRFKHVRTGGEIVLFDGIWPIRSSEARLRNIWPNCRSEGN